MKRFLILSILSISINALGQFQNIEINWREDSLIGWDYSYKQHLNAHTVNEDHLSILPLKVETETLNKQNNSITLSSYFLKDDDYFEAFQKPYGSSIHFNSIDSTRYDSISFEVKYSIIGKDQAYFNLTAMPKNGWKPVASIHHRFSGKQNIWERYSFPIHYHNTPNSYSLLFSSSERQINPVSQLSIDPGSWITIRNIQFNAHLKKGIIPYYKFIESDFLFFFNSNTRDIEYDLTPLTSGQIILTSSEEKEIYNFLPTAKKGTFSIKTLAEGIYILRIYSNGNLIQQEKIVLIDSKE